MSNDDEVQDTFAILDTELNELRETLEVAYATKDLALQNQVMRRVDQIGAMVADLEKRDVSSLGNTSRTPNTFT
jgi:hypothetical protein